MALPAGSSATVTHGDGRLWREGALKLTGAAHDTRVSQASPGRFQGGRVPGKPSCMPGTDSHEWQVCQLLWDRPSQP